MSDPMRGDSGALRTRRPRRPGRVLAAVVTLLTVLVAAATVPILLAGPSGPGGAAQPSHAAVGGPTDATPGAMPVSSFPAPAITFPSTRPSIAPSGSASFVPLSPEPGPVGVEATRIRIERLRIDLPIIEGDGFDAPMFKAAHYPGTAWPGGGSNIYIYGHAQEGMFLSLWEARKGDVVVLELVDGSQATYVVSRVIPEARWNDLSLVEPTPTEQLTLQTSTSNTETAPRFVVIAHPES